MSSILILLLKFNLKFVYFFMKFIPTNNNKIVFLSRQTAKPSIDFLLIKKELLKRNSKFKIVFLNKKLNKNIKGLLIYYFHLYSQMYHIATAKVCILDTYIIPISLLKHKKNLKIYQLWHANGAIKKFGHQTLDKPSGRNKKMALSMNMHKGYTKIICGSSSSSKFFAEAFNYPIETVVPNDLPRIDYLVNEYEEIRNKVYKIYPNLKNKKNILYVPTFRKYGNLKVQDLINLVDLKKYNMILKCHPLEEIQLENREKYEYKKISTLEALVAADYVITDYSVISIEAAVLNKKVYFYTFDYDKYVNENGLNVNLKEEMSTVVFENEDDLINSIQYDAYDYKLLSKFKKKYINKGDGKETKRLVDYIMKNNY